MRRGAQTGYPSRLAFRASDPAMIAAIYARKSTDQNVADEEK
jgi:hypothetical protein